MSFLSCADLFLIATSLAMRRLFFLFYFIFVNFCKFFELAMLRVNRLSRANLYLLHFHSEIIPLYCSFKAMNQTQAPGRCCMSSWKKQTKHDGTRKANCIRVSPAVSVFLWASSSSETGRFVTKTRHPKQDLTSRHGLLCIFICIIRLLHWPDQSCDGWTCFDTSAKKRILFLFLLISRRAFYIH